MSCDVDTNLKANDIEDLTPSDIATINDETCNSHKKTKKNYISNTKMDDENRNLSQLSNLEGGIPGTHSVYIATWGCSHNWSDSEYMAGILVNNGYKVGFEKDESLNANIWILNSCTVKGR
eukprot:287287_1